MAVPVSRVVAPVRAAGFTVGAALMVAAAVFAALVVRNAFVSAHQIVGWVVACSIVALLIDPLVARLQRHLPRWLSVILVLTLAITVFAALAAGLVRELLRSLDDLERAAPDAARGLEERYDWAADLDVTARVGDLFERIDEEVRRETVERAIGTAPTYLVTGVLTLFLLAYGRRYFIGALTLFDDLERRQFARRVASRGARRGRRYLLAGFTQAAFNGAVAGAVFWALDLAAPLILGAAVAVFSFVPTIGIILGGAPALLLAFGLHNWRVGAVVLLVLAALQAIDVWIVRPIVDRRTVRLGTTVPVVVGLLAFDLYGIGGALFGVGLAVLGLAALDAVDWARNEADET